MSFNHSIDTGISVKNNVVHPETLNVITSIKLSIKLELVIFIVPLNRLKGVHNASTSIIKSS